MDINFTLPEINDVAKKVLVQIKPGTIVALHGEMGAGKTTFSHALCEAMGVTGTISSPTFSIINQYNTASGQTVYHIDLYRIKDEDEAITAGVEDCLYSGNTCLVEWSERAPGIFPENTMHISITVTDSEQRKISW